MAAQSRKAHKAPVFQIHSSSTAPTSSDARDVARVLLEHRTKALGDERVGGLVVTVDAQGKWHASLCGSLRSDKGQTCAIIGGMLGQFSALYF